MRGFSVNQVLLSSARLAAVPLLLLCCVSGPGAVAAQVALPPPAGYVNDFANVIPAEQEAQISRIIEEVRGKSGGEIAVVTLPSLEGGTTSQVGLQILREWGVGASTEAGDSLNNTGTVILVAPTERQVRIELGYGTNTFISAGEAGRIQDEHMLPAFREGDFGTGILLGTAAVAQAYADRFGFELTGDVPQLAEPSGRGERGSSLLVFVILIILFFLITGRGGRGGGGRGGRGRRGGMPIILPFPMGGGGFGGGGFGGGGFGGGGFGGFGGGGGGGGGAGRGW